MTEQLELPYALCDVVGRTTLTVGEVAQRLGCTRQHVADLIHSQDLAAVNVGHGRSRMSARIPVEAFRDFVLRSMTCPLQHSPLRTLPLQALISHHTELTAHLRARGVRL